MHAIQANVLNLFDSLSAVNFIRFTMASLPTIDPSASDDEIAEMLKPLCASDPVRFQRIVAIVKLANRHTRPCFPPGIVVADIPTVPESDVPAFKEKYINGLYLHDYDSPEAKERLEKNGRVTQYMRWNWALENPETFVNQLRLAGHTDDKIQAMFSGVPLCFASKEGFEELRQALIVLAKEIEEEMGWTNVGFVFTGSSVPGFSQNPMKGLRGIPTRITSATSSDVDICIVADGVNAKVASCHSDGDAFLEPKRSYPTTVSELASGMRFGCKNITEFCECVAVFHKEWNEKLAGGLQFTFCEDDTDIPPWEARIPIRGA